MKNTKQLLSTVLFSGILLFSGCMYSDESIDNDASGITLEKIVAETQEKSSYFSLEKIEENKVLLVLHNPKLQKIQSFSSKIIFPTHLAKIKNLENTSEENFGLFMKSDWNIDNTTGEITIASSQTGKAKVLPENSNIATFEIEKSGNFVLDILEDNAEVYVLKNNKLQNIVNKKLVKDLIIN